MSGDDLRQPFMVVKATLGYVESMVSRWSGMPLECKWGRCATAGLDRNTDGGEREAERGEETVWLAEWVHLGDGLSTHSTGEKRKPIPRGFFRPAAVPRKPGCLCNRP